MERTAVNPVDWGKEFLMNQAEVTEGASRHLRCSGQVDLVADPDSEMGVAVGHEGDMRGQIGAALEALDGLLDGAGMGRSDIVSLRFLTTSVAQFLEHYDVYAQWIGGAGVMPPQTLLGVNELAVPGLLVEIEMEAAV
ncbi:MAG: RidA family protein [Acidimicrobiia bacterium]|nr:RidA family protein [Acidimicrobiia bacterium]